MDGEKIRVFICEDNELARHGITYALEQSGTISVVGEAEDGRQALESTELSTADVVIMDVLMPHMDGIEATKQLKLRDPAVKVLMLSAAHDDDTLFGALASGADGYCLKDSPSGSIAQAIHATASGAMWLDAAIAMKVLRNCAGSGTQTHQSISKRGAQDNKFRLSAREMDTLQFLVEGLTNREIATRMCVSAETIKTHMRHIMEKLMVSDRTQAAVKALREGLIVKSQASGE